MQDRISVEGLEVGAPVGVYDFEKGILQRLVIDISVGCDIRRAAASDALQDSLDYDRMASICRMVCQRQHHQLIETIAEKIAAQILSHYGAMVFDVSVRVAKPGAVPDAKTVAVQIVRHRSA